VSVAETTTRRHDIFTSHLSRISKARGQTWRRQLASYDAREGITLKQMDRGAGMNGPTFFVDLSGIRVIGSPTITPFSVVVFENCVGVAEVVR
jgi:hypothetical protein